MIYVLLLNNNVKFSSNPFTYNIWMLVDNVKIGDKWKSSTWYVQCEVNETCSNYCLYKHADLNVILTK